ncbi:MAG: hypothetical protein JWM80_3374 [Cyanobacteria bacterium RYN_339]|nr:hypothetical protein [Cyanobacteria bacterium RYN_339]
MFKPADSTQGTGQLPVSDVIKNLGAALKEAAEGAEAAQAVPVPVEDVPDYMSGGSSSQMNGDHYGGRPPATITKSNLQL